MINRNNFLGKFIEPVDARQCREIQNQVNAECSDKDIRVKLQNDSDNKCVNFTVRYPNQTREEFSISWEDCVNEPKTDEPVVELSDEHKEMIDEDLDLNIFLEHAGKSIKQWNNLSDNKKTEYIKTYIESK